MMMTSLVGCIADSRSTEGGEAGEGLPDDEGVDLRSSFVGENGLQVGQVAHHRALVQISRVICWDGACCCRTDGNAAAYWR